MPSQEELVDEIIQALKQIDRNDPASDKLASYLYITDSQLPNYLNKLEELLEIKQLTTSQRRECGKVLEQIMYLAFRGLQGATSFKSFQSAGPQYDLLITGDNEKWLIICKLLYLTPERRDIVIEAKAKKDKLPDKDFARLCSIMEFNFSSTGLGIFFTLEGATGFPSRNDSRRQRTIGDCRLRQVIFHAKTSKYIVVLDKNDIFELKENGSLINMLTRKIRDLQELSGLPTVSSLNMQEVDLPKHLKEIHNISNS